MTPDRIGIARAAYNAYVTKDRAAIEALIAEDSAGEFRTRRQWVLS